MAMTPAERSRPARRLPGSGRGLEEPFWGVAVIVVFIGGVVALAVGVIEGARNIASHGQASSGDLWIPGAMAVIGSVTVFGLLIAFGQHPRTRSGAASATFAAMCVVMFLSGVVLFLGGILDVIHMAEFVEQVGLAMLSLVFLAVPVFIKFKDQ